jgi:ribosomal-protein-alanine N-acetyltransferase
VTLPTLPRLHGPRVRLVPVTLPVARAVLAGDRSALHDALAPLALRPAADWPHADTGDALRPLAEYGDEGGDGGWLVSAAGADARRHEVVGDCGWRGGPDGYGDVLLGYGLSPSARRQGLGTEAVAVLCAWAERQPGVRRLVADVLPGNEPSRRLLHRLGFAEDGGDPPYLRLVRERADKIRGRHVC